jgi:2-oxoglutarate dehydrogenase E2 component (dihydrolipoamide succinyltransferase)
MEESGFFIHSPFTVYHLPLFHQGEDMSTEVVMPQMGESIAEGTITRWMKQVGERVERDEPLFEISTDKVDAEIPSPAAGTLTEIKFKEGETVEVNKVVAIIGAEGDGRHSARRERADGAGRARRAGRRRFRASARARRAAARSGGITGSRPVFVAVSGSRDISDA